MHYLTKIFRAVDSELSRFYRKLPLITRKNMQQASNSVTVSYLGSEEYIKFTKVSHVQPLHPEYECQGTIYVSPKPFIMTVREGSIRGRHAGVVTQDNKIVLESLMSYEPYLDITSFSRIHFPKSIESLWTQLTSTPHYEQVAPLVNSFSSNYYHWLLECLPRILLLEDFLKVTHNYPILLIDPSPANWILETLQMLGYQPDSYQEWTATYATASQIIVPMFPYETGLQSPYLCRRLSERLKSAVAEASPTYDTPYVYISRRKNSKRRVINEEAVLDRLSQYGFVDYQLEDLNIVEQVRLFEQAKVIIGPHGGGFSNMIFSSDATIIEFFEPSYINICFYRLASGLNFRYGYLIGESETQNMFIDVEILDKFVKNLLHY